MALFAKLFYISTLTIILRNLITKDRVSNIHDILITHTTYFPTKKIFKLCLYPPIVKVYIF